MSHSNFMSKALFLSKCAEKHADVPVGAVVVYNGEIIAEGQNKREKDNNSLAHAEIEAINEACKVRGSKYLDGCTLYVTLEPCPMCAGAIYQSRITQIFFHLFIKVAFEHFHFAFTIYLKLFLCFFYRLLM